MRHLVENFSNYRWPSNFDYLKNKGYKDREIVIYKLVNVAFDKKEVV